MFIFFSAHKEGANDTHWKTSQQRKKQNQENKNVYTPNEKNAFLQDYAL
jgi:hypothetical protein